MSFPSHLLSVISEIQNQYEKVTGCFLNFGHLQNVGSKKESMLKPPIVDFSFLPSFISDSDLFLSVEFNNLP